MAAEIGLRTATAAQTEFFTPEPTRLRGASQGSI